MVEATESVGNKNRCFPKFVVGTVKMWQRRVAIDDKQYGQSRKYFFQGGMGGFLNSICKAIMLTRGSKSCELLAFAYVLRKYSYWSISLCNAVVKQAGR